MISLSDTVKAAIVALLATPAAAEMSESAALEDLRACYAPAETPDDRRACIGAVSAACQDGPGGRSTLGISQCNQLEAQAWDTLLNEEYRETRAVMRAMDEDERALFPEFANRAETLLAAQRAWIAFRDAECANEYALAGSGSMRHIIGTACFLHKTAERTIELWMKREFF